MAELTITEYTDPGCPFAWSAEPYRWRLQWLYGDQIDWQVRMVGLAEDGSVYEDKGFTVERMSRACASSPQQHHMPMDTALRPRMAGTVPACRAVVAVRRHGPEREWAMLRALRVLHFSGRLLDEPATLAAPPSASASIPPSWRRGWPSPRPRSCCARTWPRSRTPTPGALALVAQARPHRDRPSLHVPVI